MDRLLEIIGEKHSLTPKDAGEFAALKVNGMKFTIQAFEAEGLGHVSAMRAKGMLGLMRMDTLIVNPTKRDLPLLSYDRIFAAGNDTLILELYATSVGAFACPELDRLCEAAAILPERDPGTHWYDDIRLKQSLSKKGKRVLTSAFDELTRSYLEEWLKADCPPLQDLAEKKRLTDRYVEGLLTNGGPSTDVFRKKLGDARTARLFREVLFGTKEQ